MTQYVTVRFKPHDKRTYTYSNEGEPVRVGDRVKVEGADVDKRILDKSAAADDLGRSFADMMLDADEDMQSLIDRDQE